MQFLINKFINSPDDLDILQKIKDVYSKIGEAESDRNLFTRYSDNERKEIPYNIAKNIMSDCKNYPRIVASLAERSCRIHAIKGLIPVGKISSDDKWFEQLEF